ncbi:dTMP kinase [Legionella londiniensis]|uniref:dTMP kinase n=1 Tax=Legionella londiniensis TaxID=45068 RepID=UPI00399CD451
MMTLTSKGHFIVVEGLEGAGKSTALNTIKGFLASRTAECITVREPGGTPTGELLRHIITNAHAEEMLDARAELLLLYASRVQLLEQVILPALARGSWVLADRFELSTFAYQGGGRKLDHEFIECLSTHCLKGFRPNLTLFLDISPEKGLRRAKKRGRIDRIERESLAFFNDVYKSYHDHIRTMEHVVVIDASKPLAQVQSDIQIALEDYMKHHAANASY